MKQAFITTMVYIARQIPDNITTQQVKQVEPAIKHIEEVANSWVELLPDKNVIAIFTPLGRYYQGQTLYSEAEYWLKKGVKITKSRFGEEHRDVAISLSNLAYLYKFQGRYSEAKPLYQQALEMRQRLFETDHSDVANSLNNLADLYKSQGHYSDAEALYKQALEMYQRLFQADHPYVATSLNNLAGLYHSQGRYSEAEPLYIQALEMSERTLGDSHPNTITVRGNYAECLRQLTATQKNNQSQKSSSVEDLLQQMEAMIDQLKDNSSD